MREYFFSRPALIFAIFLIAVVAAVASACSNKRFDISPPGCTGTEESEFCTDRTDPPTGHDYIARDREFRGDFQ